MNDALVCFKETKSKNYIWTVYKALVTNLTKFILIFCQCREKFNVDVKISVLWSAHVHMTCVYSVNVCCPLINVQVQSLEEEIEKEKKELNKSKISQEASIRKLKTELSATKQKLQETEVSCFIYFLYINMTLCISCI